MERAVNGKMATVTYRDIVRALRELELGPESRIIAHASLSALGDVRGGAETVIGAVLSVCGAVVMPAFTYQTMIWPESGPADNGCTYGDHAEENARAVMFECDLPVDPSMGGVAEVFRRNSQAVRSDHPVLSFAAAGKNAAEIAGSQSLENPLGPIDWLYQHDGDVLLLGVDHRADTAIHLAERLAGRKEFVRWAVGPERAYRLPNFPGCSQGFNAIASRLAWVTQQSTAGKATVQRIPLKNLIETAVQMIQEDPRALLCDDPNCQRCDSARGASAMREE